MAVASLNPVITTLSGRIGNAVFYCRRGTQCARAYVVPRNPDTYAQRAVRGNFASAVKAWQQMSTTGKYAFTRKARGLGMSGYNLFISVFMTGNSIRQKKYSAAWGKAFSAKKYTHPDRIHSVSLPSMACTAVNALKSAGEYG